MPEQRENTELTWHPMSETSEDGELVAEARCTIPDILVRGLSRHVIITIARTMAAEEENSEEFVVTWWLEKSWRKARHATLEEGKAAAQKLITDLTREALETAV